MGNNEFYKTRGFEVVEEGYREVDTVYLPLRGTKTSAGYDFFTVEPLIIAPEHKVKFKTDIKAYMLPDEFLFFDIRSSIGSKMDLMITNTIGIVDSDYYGNKDNDGNIQIGLRNMKPAIGLDGLIAIEDSYGRIVHLPLVKDLTDENTVLIPSGVRVCQAIFMKYLESDNCNSQTIREGGIGHTGV
jgi:dUTP pyrophosphatase